MKLGSLFSGIGGLDLGFERAGFEILWQVEKDAFCQKILRKHWPHTEIYGDVTTVDFTQVQQVQGLIGGFPCQPVSIAGRRQGGADERWLWPEFARAICLVRPEFVCFENTTGLLTVDGGWRFCEILSDLAALGFDAEWQPIQAAAFGAPHLRERTFLVAYPNKIGCGRSVFGLPENKQSNDPFEALPFDLGRGGFWNLLPTPRICRSYDGIPQGRNRNRGLGNAVVPQVAEFVARCIARFFERENKYAQTHPH